MITQYVTHNLLCHTATSYVCDTYTCMQYMRWHFVQVSNLLSQADPDTLGRVHDATKTI